VLPETVKGIADSFLFFLAYTYARQRRLAALGSSKLSTLEEISVGVVAGAFAKLWTTPLQNIVTRKQAAAMTPGKNTSSNISEIARQIRSEKGLQGFWSGYSATLILTLNPSITFLLHRVLSRLLVPRARRSDPGARITFILAAISKVVASTLTYPFALAKTRAQVSSQKPTQRTGPTSESDKAENVIEEKALHARQRTVISTIIQIARTEGVLGLYQGLGAEVLKAFFSHGFTMLAKDRIHTLVINLYYLVLKALKKYPSPDELAKMASEQAKDTYSKGAEVAGSAAEKAQDALSNGKQQAGELFGKSKDAASNVSRQVQDSFNKKAGGSES
jgi:hypothetical protein